LNLYHYTDQQGFLGIFENEELWATKIQFLNDNSEYKIATTIARAYIETLMKDEVDENKIFRLRRWDRCLDSFKNSNTCVFSLSEQGDLLSQWRGYSSSLGGYSIGFKKDVLASFLHSIGFSLEKCIYERKKQEERIHSMMDNLWRKYKDTKEENEHKINLMSSSSNEFFSNVHNISPILKDSSFSEENEWRIVSKGGVNFNRLSFRVGKSMLVPFLKIALPNFEDGLINEIIVGHTPHLDLAENATQSCVFKRFPDPHNTARPRVLTSKVPFRNW
jgi:hypothetical protein